MLNELFRTHDPRLLEVVLHRSRYENHIKIQHVIEVESIQETIESPDLITMDRHDGYKENYYASGVIPGFSSLILKVCVLFREDLGRVITAFEVEEPHPKEQIIWEA